MKAKSLVFCVALLLALTVAPAFAGVIFVPSDYPTIQGAVNNANPGDIIIVYPGDYTSEHEITIQTPYLTIVSTEVGKYGCSTLVEGFNVGFAPNGGPEGVTIAGFNVSNPNAFGVGLESSANYTTFHHNYVHGCVDAGIRVNEGGNTYNNIHHNICKFNLRGIELEGNGSSDHQVHQNIICNSTYSGIYLEGADNCNVHQNKVKDSAGDPTLWAASADNNKIHQNVVCGSIDISGDNNFVHHNEYTTTLSVTGNKSKDLKNIKIQDCPFECPNPCDTPG